MAGSLTVHVSTWDMGLTLTSIKWFPQIVPVILGSSYPAIFLKNLVLINHETHETFTAEACFVMKLGGCVGRNSILWLHLLITNDSSAEIVFVKPEEADTCHLPL